MGKSMGRYILNQYGRTYLKRSIMMLDFTCVNLAILVLIGLVASEADPQLVYQQPSYIYPGGHPVYRMAGLPYAYPIYNPAAIPQERAGSSIASGPEMVEIIKNLKPAPAFYADCNSEAQSQINEINRIRGFVNKVECEQNLVWLAWKHTKDQIDWENIGGTHDDNCNLHSWFTAPELRCCYPSDHSQKECMWMLLKKFKVGQLEKCMKFLTWVQTASKMLRKHGKNLVATMQLLLDLEVGLKEL